MFSGGEGATQSGTVYMGNIQMAENATTASTSATTHRCGRRAHAARPVLNRRAGHACSPRKELRMLYPSPPEPPKRPATPEPRQPRPPLLVDASFPCEPPATPTSVRTTASPFPPAQPPPAQHARTRAREYAESDGSAPPAVSRPSPPLGCAPPAAAPSVAHTSNGTRIRAGERWPRGTAGELAGWGNDGASCSLSGLWSAERSKSRRAFWRVTRPSPDTLSPAAAAVGLRRSGERTDRASAGHRAECRSAGGADHGASGLPSASNERGT
mmetsp:Transcript_1275/g.4121  ORF Transcript_1275/g.4121 Transcript_1275/m.4121 type:complete len:270 (-) Transcript_1275:13-822(-)